MEELNAPSSEDMPLATLFERAAQISESTSSLIDEKSVQEAEAWLRRIQSFVDVMGVFSANEDADDIATGDIKYLLVPFHLAELQMRTTERDPAVRRQLLQDAGGNYLSFLEACDQYSLIPPEAKMEQPVDPQTKRQMKIARYQREKAAKARLTELQQALVRCRRLKELGGVGDDPSDSEREIWLTKISLAIPHAVDQLSLIKQETEMLQHAAKLSPGEHADRGTPAPPSTDLLNALQITASKLGSKREQIRAEVFRPSHRLPTRTLEEQALIEVKQAKDAVRAQEAAQKRREVAEADEEFALLKQRAWDDWKDENPRGSGNSKLRPTA